MIDIENGSGLMSASPARPDAEARPVLRDCLRFPNPWRLMAIAISRFARDSKSYFRLGRFTNSPPQFGQTFFIPAAHFSQKVHSYEQIIAIPFAVNGRWHFSHSGFICNAITASV
jgi:hypothetical protein